MSGVQGGRSGRISALRPSKVQQYEFERAELSPTPIVHVETYCCAGKPRLTRQHSTIKRRAFVFGVRAGIDIDRRAFFNQQLRRQLEAEAIEAEADISCPIHCVREVQSLREFEKVLSDAQEHNKLVVLDFYDTSCGSCKYILPQFIKLCKK